MAAEARLVDGTLVFSGVLDRAAVVALWPQLSKAAGHVLTLDLQTVTALDSAGLALLAELADGGAALLGQPAGLDELSTAYRLGPQLGFASSTPSVV